MAPARHLVDIVHVLTSSNLVIFPTFQHVLKGYDFGSDMP